MMRKELERSKTESNIRRSSVHFHYQSEEEVSSQIQIARAFNFSQSHITSESNDTIKTTNLYSNRLHESSLSGFAVPAFNLPKDSKKKSDQTQKAQQEQFYTFLETFGRESEFTSSENSNGFEENQTVCHRSSTAQKRDSSTNIANKQEKPQPKPVQLRPKKAFQQPQNFQIDQSDEQDQSDLYQSAQQDESKQSKHPWFQKKVDKPKMVQFCVQTDFTPKKETPIGYERRPYKKRENKAKQFRPKQSDHGCYNSLVFTEFNEQEMWSDTKYPKRVTRECAPLKFWLGERIDYQRGGYWLQKER